MEAGGLLCSRYFLNGGAGLPARCQGAALAPLAHKQLCRQALRPAQQLLPALPLPVPAKQEAGPGVGGGRTERAPQPPVRTHSGLLMVFGIENYFLPGEWVKDV